MSEYLNVTELQERPLSLFCHVTSCSFMLWTSKAARRVIKLQYFFILKLDGIVSSQIFCPITVAV